ncbi:translation initiation factor aIF-2 [Spizellomyces punctatus DAOM BR117]|uniref:Eukaryotic translation initiation factor 5B n=1 Tax=Spizellomyces punctatus (strain DAOM BR117) TaxID=645134 RepID=A0A0L0H5W5_SPIPD|nr:translation initiation factor aIF-2 [Spizellomyces punctatus DAOM BR117]KNC96910.1 translation initiation factor aIF-2 [Spizellomyces punctatus DAOM BR117]|eukprot:XP_016604950.1 translation initiation factor aIF-2 [Spizellomyces punctatus DAOM BR117]
MAKKKGGKNNKQPVKTVTPQDSDSEVEIAFGAAEPEAVASPEETFNVDEEGNDLGGLMATLMANKGKKGKKSKKNRFEDEEDAAAILAQLDQEDAAQQEEPANSVSKPNKKAGKKGKKGKGDDFDAEMAKLASEIDGGGSVDAEEKPEGPVAPVKGKKGKSGKEAARDDFDAEMDQIAAETEQTETSPVAKPKGKAPKAQDAEEEETGEIRIKSKKEKERERKERLKLAKKQQQPKGAGKVSPSPVATPEPEPEPIEDEKPDKKKKGAAKKKGPSVLAALREQLAAQKAAEEELKRQQEEEERRLAEEQQRIEEEEKRKEEAKQRKKEKERLKKEELKKQGKYLTPAQKAAQAQQKARLEAMIAAGMKVEALDTENVEADKKPKRVVYTNRKKKQPTKAEQPVKVEAPKPEEPEKENKKEEGKREQQRIEKKAEEDAAAVAAAEEAARVLAVMQSTMKEGIKESWDDESDGDVKDSWDQSSDEETVKDSWDQESDEEDKKVAAKPAKAPVTKTSEVVKKVVEVKKPANGKAPVAAKNAKVQEKKVDDDSDESEEESEEESSEEESSEDESSDEDDSDEELTATQKQALKRKEEAAARRQARHEQALAERSAENLRSPICCILGHVDTGKTKLLDKIRQTNVQEGEAGGITQQIGATYFPMDAIKEKTALLHKDQQPDYKLPGLLIIDTPGHESFTNLRSRGSSLCNIAILVVDIVHGLEPQTLESLGLLRQRKTPFIVALNKIDRMYDWKAMPNHPTRDTLAQQKPHVLKEFQERVNKVIVEFAEQGLNACLYWENPNYAKNVSLVPTSAITGEGIPDLLHLLVDLTQTRMTERLMYLSELECTVLEVKVIEGLGTTIDVVLSNGVLNEGDRIVVCGLNGPIVTTIRALLTPQPMRELRVKSAYVHHKSVKASLGIKISAPDLEKAIAGSRLMVLGPDDDEDDIKEVVMEDLTSLLSSIDKSGKGVCVQASTLGSLEALLTFLKSCNIPVSGINIGPVHKKDIIRASVMLERAPEYAQLLAFDVPIDKDAEQMAEEMGVKIFTAEIIYHLFDQFTAYMKNMEEKKRADAAPKAVFPCALRIVPGAVFNKRNPIVLGVDVIDGNLKIGTPLCVVNEETKGVISLGRVTSIELNHKVQQEAKKGGPSVAIKIESPEYETPKLFGRHFTERNEIYSHITRASIDILKTTFRNDLSKDDWQLVIRLKKALKID